MTKLKLKLISCAFLCRVFMEKLGLKSMEVLVSIKFFWFFFFLPLNYPIWDGGKLIHLRFIKEVELTEFGN